MKETTKDTKESKAPSSFKKEAKSLIVLMVVTFLSMYVFTNFIFRPIRVEGSSMYPNLEDGYRGFTNRISYTLSGVERGDIVVVKSPLVDGDYWVKRIVGMPNETIEVKNGILYIDGEVFLEDAYLGNDIVTSDFEKRTLGSDEYFLMGDNREKSKDSRDDQVGPFKESMIVGKDIIVLYPFDEISYKK